MSEPVWREQDLGVVSAFGVAKEHGWTGTEAEWEALQAAAPELALKAESYGAGTRDGEPVDSDDPAYENNAEHYATQAQIAAASAAESAEDAAQYTSDAVHSWLSENIDPASDYALDRTLTEPLAAAPADLVGDLKSAIAQSNVSSDIDFVTGVTSGMRIYSSGYIGEDSNMSYTAPFSVKAGQTVDAYITCKSSSGVICKLLSSTSAEIIVASDSTSKKHYKYTFAEDAENIVICFRSQSGYSYSGIIVFDVVENNKTLKNEVSSLSNNVLPRLSITENKVSVVENDLSGVLDTENKSILSGWVRGSINNDGDESVATDRGRSDFIELKPTQAMTVMPNSYSVRWVSYDASKEKTGESSFDGGWTNDNFELTNNSQESVYYRIVCKNLNGGDVVVESIDIGIYYQYEYYDFVGLTKEINTNYLAYADTKLLRMPFTRRRYIDVSNAVGTLTDVTMKTSNNYVCAIVPVKENDMILVSCLGTTNVAGYAILDTDYIMLEKSATDAGQITKKRIFIEEDGYFIVNSYTTGIAELLLQNNDVPHFVLVDPVRFMANRYYDIYPQQILYGLNAEKVNAVISDVDKAQNRKASVRFRFTDTTYKTYTGKIKCYPTDLFHYIDDNLTIEVIPENAGNGVTKTALLIGDSLTYGNGYCYVPNELASLAASGNLNMTWIGTLYPSHTTYGNTPNEGRPSWSAKNYVYDYNIGNAWNNAFYNPNLETDEKFDFSYYMTQNNFSGVDYVFINLGTNGRSDPDDVYVNSFKYMVNNIHSYDPNIRICIWIPSDGCQMAGNNAYSTLFPLEHSEMIINEFKNRESERIYLSPVGWNVDPEHDYDYEEVDVSSRNPDFKVIQTITAHPSRYGYLKIADVLYATLKYFAYLDSQ